MATPPQPSSSSRSTKRMPCPNRSADLGRRRCRAPARSRPGHRHDAAGPAGRDPAAVRHGRGHRRRPDPCPTAPPARLVAVPAPSGLRTLSDISTAMLDHVPRAARMLRDPDEQRLLRICASAVTESISEPGDRLLHWDTPHHHNILAGQRQPWLAIDPKPLARRPPVSQRFGAGQSLAPGRGHRQRGPRRCNPPPLRSAHRRTHPGSAARDP